MREFLIILAAGFVTYALRVVFLVSRHLRVPRWMERWLPGVGPAVLAAITLPALVAPQGEISLGETLPSLLAAAATWAIFHFTKRLPVALVGGMLVWWGLLAAFAALL